MLKQITSLISTGTKTFLSLDLVANFVRDLKSLRAAWNWIVGVLFVWVVWYSLTHYPDSATTVVTVVGGIFTAMMTNYTWSSYLEKKNKCRTEDLKNRDNTDSDQSD